jgi:hypothetical protein
LPQGAPKFHQSPIGVQGFKFEEDAFSNYIAELEVARAGCLRASPTPVSLCDAGSSEPRVGGRYSQALAGAEAYFFIRARLQDELRPFSIIITVTIVLTYI